MASTLPSVSDCCTLCEGLTVTIVTSTTPATPCECNGSSGTTDPTTPGTTDGQTYINVTCGSLWYWTEATSTWTQVNLAGATGMYVVPTIVELRQIATTTCVPVWARTLGNLVTYDGQGSEYGWEGASTDADDGMSIIKPDDVAVGDPGRWLQITSS